jgi:hypothetical protein
MTERESPYLWSATALTNGSVDPSINFAEGQLPGTVNNSSRSLMATFARWLKDNNSTISTGGSANAYTLTINGTQTAYATGHLIAFKASFTNTSAATLNVTNADATALGAKAIRVLSIAGDSALAASQILQNGLYLLRYDAAANSAAGAWILKFIGTGIVGNSRILAISATTAQNVQFGDMEFVDFSGPAPQYGSVSALEFSVAYRCGHGTIRAQNCGSNNTAAIGYSQSDYGVFGPVDSHAAGWTGTVVYYGSENVFAGLTQSYTAGGRAVKLQGACRNKIGHLCASHAQGVATGIYIVLGSDDNKIASADAYSNGGPGFTISASTGNQVGFVRASGNAAIDLATDLAGNHIDSAIVGSSSTLSLVAGTDVGSVQFIDTGLSYTQVANGTAALPSVTFASDPDSGFYRIGANNVGIAVNGAKAVDVATTGVSLLATNTNDDPASGYFGEYKANFLLGANNRSATCTISIASPCVVSWSGHPLFASLTAVTAIMFTTTGALPTGLVASTIYYATWIDAATFHLSTTVANAIAGTYINTSGSQSGTQTADIRVALASSNNHDLAAIQLAAGDWNVQAAGYYIGNGSTVIANTQLELNTSSATQTFTEGRYASDQFPASYTPGNATFKSVITPTARFSLSGTSTIFATMQALFTVGSLSMYCGLTARRVR